MPNIDERIVDRNKNIEKLEHLNNEINLERTRMKYLEKNKELIMEKTNSQRTLNTLYKEIRSLLIDIEFLSNFDKLMDTEEKLRIILEDQSKGSKKKGNKENAFKNEKLLAILRVIISLNPRVLLGREMMN